MTAIKDEMPLLARHAGDWVGTYTLIDTEGNILDKHKSHLTCQFPESGPYAYYQVNRYEWADGKREEHQFPATYRDKQIWFDTDRIQGHAWEVDDATIILTWNYKSMPGTYLYEMIQLSPCGNYRARTWHWFSNYQIVRRTLIQEERVR